jgi:hypothetical protein
MSPEPEQDYFCDGISAILQGTVALPAARL